MDKNDRSMVGMLAESRAGHDLGQVYVIIKEEKEYVYVSDGHLRPVDKLKKKNKKHIQIIRKPEQELGEKILNAQVISNEEVKRAIKLFRKKIQK